jgi:hypothetical protein
MRHTLLVLGLALFLLSLGNPLRPNSKNKENRTQDVMIRAECTGRDRASRLSNVRLTFSLQRATGKNWL